MTQVLEWCMAAKKKTKKYEVDHDRLKNAVREMLAALGEDPTRDGLTDTPRRIADMYTEVFSGLQIDPSKYLEVEFEVAHNELVILREIPFYSMCLPSRQVVNVVGGAKRACDVKAGDALWTLVDGRTVQTVVQTVTSRACRELVEVRTEHGSFQCTPDHPFATPEGWVEARDLAGLSVEWTPPRSLWRQRFQPELGYSLGYAIGAVFSDGTVGDRSISLVVNDEWFAAKFQRSLESAFGIEAEIEEVSRPSGYTGRDTPGFRVRVVSSYLADLFRMWAGGDAHHMRQRFPRVVLGSQDTMQGFIDGYVDGDGVRVKSRDSEGPPTRSNGALVVSGNVEFLREFAEVIEARFTESRSSTSQLYVSDRWHRAGWFGRHGFRPEEHRTSLLESSWVRVESVTPLEGGTKPWTVYSYQCAPHPTFLVGGFLSHNCEHHFLPFHGQAHVGYIPRGRVVGLSKLARVVEVLARRPQIQEQLTTQIADVIMKKLNPGGVAVVIEAEHLCVTMRGIRKPGARMVTSAMRGEFENSSVTRNEFLALVHGRR